MIRTTRVILLAALSIFLLGAPASGQSGIGGVSGFVLPAHPDHPAYPQSWGDSLADSTYSADSPTISLIPVATHMDFEPQSQKGLGRSGAYEFGHVPMGRYLLRAEAPGYETWEAEIYVLSDTLGKVYILLDSEND